MAAAHEVQSSVSQPGGFCFFPCRHWIAEQALLVTLFFLPARRIVQSRFKPAPTFYA
jgi:hypothetical protein